MSELVDVGLHTLPSTWVGLYSGKLSTPYRRIVGTEYGSGMAEVNWARNDAWHPETAYEPRSASFEIVSMPVETAQRLLGFFKRYFSDNPRTQTTYSALDRKHEDKLTETYNCHRFGYWMRGALTAKDFELPEAPDHITRLNTVDTPLAIGRHGVLGTVGAAVHSIVGLGEDNNECLQVLSSQGNIGIDTYDRIIDQYDQDRARGMQFFA